MDDIQTEAIRRSRVFLVKTLILDVLWDYLLEKGIFNDEMKERIQCASTPSESKRRLISDLLRRPREAYEDFLTCLDLADHKHCADKIRENEYQVRREQGCLSGVPDNTPHNEVPALSSYCPPQVNLALTQEATSDVDMSDRSNTTPYICSPTPDTDCNPSDGISAYALNRRVSSNKVYEMESKPRGYVYMINNHQFDNFDARNGTQIDCRKLEKLFSQLGYFVSTDRDLKAEEMKRRLKEFAKFPENLKVDSLIVVILSHGEQDDIIFGTDGESTNRGFKKYLTIKHLKSWFGNRRCPELEGKPKLFLIQACRGQSEDIGSASASVGSSVQRDVVDFPADTTADIMNESSLPEQSDMIFAHSSVPGYVSYRDPEQGSVFINALVNVFTEESHREHLADMLTMVNKKIVDEFHTPEGLKCLSSPVNQLTKKWFFNLDQAPEEWNKP
ncbi:caspase-3-like [Gigantopelta aegis]|uniref:caspase-3-like n=1 Tax=Gigantopelta aegis TaxID=1735272 RepID=UPI001B88CD34|nr:caspase-3-like [Gigantopelta aegis]XP_041378169.1 caspase-3-like [Gigantopelta aegis]